MMKTWHKGVHAEIVACAYLLKHGYDVYRNISLSGPIDVIGIKDGETYYFDVKSKADSIKDVPLTKDQVDQGIMVILVDPLDQCTIVDQPRIAYTAKAETADCAVCGTPFQKTARKQIYCGRRCNMAAHAARRAAAATVPTG